MRASIAALVFAILAAVAYQAVSYRIGIADDTAILVKQDHIVTTLLLDYIEEMQKKGILPKGGEKK